MSNSLSSLANLHPQRARYGSERAGLTLVEMLIAMAITLLMMAAVVSVFASVSSSVANRRSAAEMTSRIRDVRNLLQRDLAGATCPGIPWQRTDANHGYIEIIEGPRSDFDPSLWLINRNGDNALDVAEPTSGETLDLATSTLPSSNLARLPGNITAVNTLFEGAQTDGGGLGDWDDILMLTVRNEADPFAGNVPGVTTGGFFEWGSQSITSPLAEVAWFAVENPVEDPANRSNYFGEPGFRTIYRRTLLIAPWLNYGFVVPGPGGNQTTGPGVVRVLGSNVPRDAVTTALASLVAFQERYDLSVRLEWDPLLGVDGRWKLVANSLADLTKRENRFEHHGYFLTGGFAANLGDDRRYPFVVASEGDYDDAPPLRFASDREAAGITPAAGRAIIGTEADRLRKVENYEVSDVGSYVNGNGTQDPIDDTSFGRPFVWVGATLATTSAGSAHATPRAIVNEFGQVVAITNGLAPLGGDRRGDDVVMTDALAFDLRVYDPKAPVLAEIRSTTANGFPGSAIEPGDAGWGAVFSEVDNAPPTIVLRGAYVDLGYYRLHQIFSLANDDIGRWSSLSDDQVNLLLDSSVLAHRPSLKSQMRPANQLASAVLDPYRVYDTWSFHYENNGLDEDDRENDGLTTVVPDEGTNGFDNADPSIDGDPRYLDSANDVNVFGPDDAGERETAPPYDTRLRGIQVTLRAYETDSRQFREVKVSQTFVPK